MVQDLCDIKPQMYNVSWRGPWCARCRHKSRMVYTRWSVLPSAHSLLSYKQYNFLTIGKKQIYVSYGNLQLVWYLFYNSEFFKA